MGMAIRGGSYAHTITSSALKRLARRPATPWARVAVGEPSVPTMILLYPMCRLRTRRQGIPCEAPSLPGSAHLERAGHLLWMHVAPEEVRAGRERFHVVGHGLGAVEEAAPEQDLGPRGVRVEGHVVHLGVLVVEHDGEDLGGRGGQPTRVEC